MLFNNPYSRLMAQTGVTPQPQPGPMSLMMPAAMGPSLPSELPVGPMMPPPPQPATQAAYEGPNVGPMPRSLVSEARTMPRERSDTPVGPMLGLMNNINQGDMGGLGGLGGMTFDDDPVGLSGLGDQFRSDIGWLGADLENLFGLTGMAAGGNIPWGPAGQVGNIGMLNDLVGGWGALMG